jgi:hypothetical protein
MSILKTRVQVQVKVEAITNSAGSVVNQESLAEYRRVIRVLGGWVASCLGVLLDPPLCPNLESLDSRYHPFIEMASISSFLGVTTRQADTLWTAFTGHCYARGTSPHSSSTSCVYSQSPGLCLSDWIRWTCPRSSKITFASRPLLEAVFLSQLKNQKNEWR